MKQLRTLIEKLETDLNDGAIGDPPQSARDLETIATLASTLVVEVPPLPPAQDDNDKNN